MTKGTNRTDKLEAKRLARRVSSLFIKMSYGVFELLCPIASRKKKQPPRKKLEIEIKLPSSVPSNGWSLKRRSLRNAMKKS